MSDCIAWWVELAVKPGRLENFRQLTRAMVDFTRNEPGVLCYQRFVSDDEAVVHAYEQYEDSDAALAHLRNFRERFSRSFLTMVDRRRFTVYGTPNAELKGVLDSLGAVYLKRFGDLDYWP
jgi:quinol monooxygenase YgiN